MDGIRKSDQKVCVIHVHLGPWPWWVGVFLAGVRFNPDLDWLIVSDLPLTIESPANLRHVLLERQVLEILIRDKTGIRTRLEDPRKLCDFKPAYGKIFEEHLAGYDWWGYCDNDLLFGNVGDFLMPGYFSEFDIISSYPGYLSGPFCLYRNVPLTTRLYSRVPGYREVLQSEFCEGFDENLRGHPAGRKFSDFLRFPLFFLGKLFQKSIKRPGFREIRYQYHWRIKRSQAGRQGILDMTDLVFNEMAGGRIRACFLEMMHSDTSFLRLGMKNWKLKWSNGLLQESCSGKELFAFHFREMKKNLKQAPCPGADNLTRLELDRNGFRF